MWQRWPRDFDPHALERMPDEPPRDLDAPPAPGRWLGAEAWWRPRRAPKAEPGKAQRAQPARGQRDHYDYLNCAGGQSGWQDLGALIDMSLGENRYGFVSRALELYPQTFKNLNTVFWHEMSDEERAELLRLQAAAQERVGFERNTRKFFIGDVQVEGLPGPGEEPSTAELLTDFDTDYTLRRKAYQQRQREREEIRQGKRKRFSQYTTSRDESNCLLLGLPTVVQGIKKTPGLTWMLPGALAVSEHLAQQPPEPAAPVAPFPEGLGLRPAAGKRKRRVSYKDLPRKPDSPAPAKPEPTAPPGKHAASAAPASEQPSVRPPGLVTRRFSRKPVQIDTSNRYGLKSRSELDYPQAYEPIAPQLWAGLTEDERRRVMRVQAIAQEKAGFERGAPKYFIEDFDPAEALAPSTHRDLVGRLADTRRPVSPFMLAGGVLLALAGGGLIALWQLHLLNPLTAMAAIVLVAAGLALCGVGWRT